MLGGHPREVRWTVTQREGKDPDSSDSRKTFIILIFTCCIVSYVSFVFFFLPPTPIVVVDFIGTMKSS